MQLILDERLAKIRRIRPFPSQAIDMYLNGFTLAWKIPGLKNSFRSETNARTKLDQAAAAFHERGPIAYTKSANLFLESWRILQSELESSFYDLDRKEEDGARDIRERTLLGCIALHDLGIACRRNSADYRDAGKCKLQTHALRSGWVGNTITEDLEIEEEPYLKGRGVAHVLPLQDPLGRLLDGATTFAEAAIISAQLCSHQLACLSNRPSPGDLSTYESFNLSLLFVFRSQPEITDGPVLWKYKGKIFGNTQANKNDSVDDE